MHLQGLGTASSLGEVVGQHASFVAALDQHTGGGGEGGRGGGSWRHLVLVITKALDQVGFI